MAVIGICQYSLSRVIGLYLSELIFLTGIPIKKIGEDIPPVSEAELIVPADCPLLHTTLFLKHSRILYLRCS